MNNTKVFFIVLFFLSTLYVGLEILPSWSYPPLKELPPTLTHEETAGNANDGKVWLEKAECKKCHSIEKAGIKATLSEATLLKYYSVGAPDLSTLAHLYTPKALDLLINAPSKHPYDVTQYTKEDAKKGVKDLYAYAQTLEEQTPIILVKDACLRCHSIKYNDAFSYAPSSYSVIEKKYGGVPMDLSLLAKTHTKERVSLLLQEPSLLESAHPKLNFNEKSVERMVEYLFEEKEKASHESIGAWVLFYFGILSLLLYLKILLQQRKEV